MQGKRGVVMGVANNKSIAWGIAKSLVARGAEVILTYFDSGDTSSKFSTAVAELGGPKCYHCDVSKDEDIVECFSKIRDDFTTIDFVVHSIAFSDKAYLKGPYYDVSKENFLNTINVSCYSFTAITREASKMMPDGGSLLTISYYGAEKVVPHYHVMGVAKAALEAGVRYLAYDLGKKGIRVNAIASGTLLTLSSSAIPGIATILKYERNNAPLNRNLTLEDLGKSATYLLSDLSCGVTGEVIQVDCGCNIVGMQSTT